LLVLRVDGARGEFVLAILHRAETEDSVEDIRCLIDKHAPSEAKKVMRLTKVGDARPFPVVEQFVRAAVCDRPVTLEKQYVTASARERDAGRQAR
jgi:hypothetical protein